MPEPTEKQMRSIRSVGHNGISAVIRGRNFSRRNRASEGMFYHLVRHEVEWYREGIFANNCPPSLQLLGCRDGGLFYFINSLMTIKEGDKKYVSFAKRYKK